MRFAIAGGRRQCGVGPAENACHVATIFPAPGADARDRKVRNRDISGLDVHEQGRRQHCLIQRSEQRGLADTAGADDEHLRARLLCEALVCSENFHRSFPMMRSSATPSGPRAVPSASRQSARRITSGSVPCCRASEHTMALSRAAVSACELLLWFERNSSAIPPLAKRLYEHV